MSDLIKKFNSIEIDYIGELVNGIPVWPLVREDIYQEINEKKTGISKPNISDKNHSIVSKLKSLLRVCKNTLQFILYKKKQSDYLILNHPRKKLIDGKYQDIYTDPIIDELKGSYLCLEPLFQMRHLTPSYRENVLYADIFDYWPRLISLLVPYKFNKEQREVWKNLEVRIETEFGIKVEIVKKLEIEIRRVLISLPWLVKFLKVVKPSIIIEIVGYSRLSKHINIAAHSLNIPTIELQHGIISEGHVAYNFPQKSKNIPSFPSYLGIWTDFYKGRMNIPISDSNVVKTGFKYFENELKRVSKLNNNNGSVLFISQGSIGKYLIPIVIEYVQLTKAQVIYKLHPSEIQDANVRYKKLYELEAANLIIDDNIESDLYRGMMEADVVVGVYSTALLESASLGKTTVVLKIEGWKYFEDLISNRKLPLYLSEANAKGLNSIIINSKKEPIEGKLDLMGNYDDSFIEKMIGKGGGR